MVKKEEATEPQDTKWVALAECDYEFGVGSAIRNCLQIQSVPGNESKSALSSRVPDEKKRLRVVECPGSPNRMTEEGTRRLQAKLRIIIAAVEMPSLRR
jgi:hypothetical protein